MRTAIVGGGAAGFFLAISLKEMMPEMEVTIFERSSRLLAKVEISGGGRCNCTNSFASIRDLSAVYPRGHRLMKRLFKTFNYQDAYTWFEQHGIELVTQDDECVFPASQDAHTIINCFLHEARRHGVLIKTQHPIQQLDELADYNYIAVTTGGSPRLEGLRWLSEKGIVMEPPVPSLFTFRIDDKRLQELMGTVVEEAVAYIPGTKLKATGPLLITHWGMSGPAILKLSSYAARELHEQQYQMPLAINWTCRNEAEVEEELHRLILMHPQKQLATIRPFNLPSRLWSYLLERVVGHQAQERWQHIGKKDFHRLVNVLINDTYAIAGRAAFKDEFVTCGGVSLTAVNLSTLSSKLIPNLYFAGEVLDIDGITGGFNFQAAWTTAYTVAKSIYNDATTR
ncbi:MAG: NAD(P)/FAD-dependent oxidoreductase [Prevotella sp.]|nr:NAD(P)/FAD-dependent oxidoreductase [Prevotella sp.]